MVRLWGRRRDKTRNARRFVILLRANIRSVGQFLNSLTEHNSKKKARKKSLGEEKHSRNCSMTIVTTEHCRTYVVILDVQYSYWISGIWLVFFEWHFLTTVSRYPSQKQP